MQTWLLGLVVRLSMDLNIYPYRNLLYCLIVRTHVIGSSEFNKSFLQLHESSIKNKVNEAMDLMKENKFGEGEKIEKRLWPRLYQKKYLINNLWRYRIRSYRLLYTIITQRDVKKYALLDILPHDKYNKLFKYHSS